MLIDWLIYGLLIFGIVALLNATAFKSQPASRLAAWSLTVVIFLVNLVAMTALQYVRYRAISNDLGLEFRPRNPIDAVGAFTFSWLFFALLRKLPKAATGPSQESQPTLAPRQVPSANHGMQGLEQPEDIAAEQFWADALVEFDSSSRRPGLWAKSFAEAEGIEARAKAKYLKYRSAELEKEHRGNAASRARLQAEQARLAEIAQLPEAERIYALLPKGTCPNCSAVFPLSQETCPKCTAMFGTDKRWRLTPASET